MGNSESADQFKPSKDKTWRAYCAIDVGAISCSYAYSFDGVDHTWMNKNWAEGLGYSSLRTPSAILYDKSGAPEAFGFDAIDKYLTLSKKEAEQSTLLYDGLLEVSDVDIGLKTYVRPEYSDPEDSESEDDDDDDETPEEKRARRKGSFLPDPILKTRCDIALLLAKHCKKDIDSKYSHYKSTPDEFLWAVVVPLTWNVDQKHRFKKLLEEAFRQEFENQLKENKYAIILVASTEALWSASKEKAMDKLTSSTRNPFKKAKKTKAVISWHSGGTATEVSIHTKKSGAKPIDVKFIPIGGRYLNHLFEGHLASSGMHDGKKFLHECKTKYLGSWLDLLQKFEAARKAIHYDKETSVSMDLNFAFSDAYNKITGRDLSDEMSQDETSNSMRVILSQRGKLVLNGRLTKEIGTNAVERVWTDISGFLDKHRKSVDYCGLLLTGGFGESALVREYLSSLQQRRQLDDVKLYTPENSTSLLTMGAILSAKKCQILGHNIALLYDARSKVTGGDNPKFEVEKRIYPLMIQGQSIEIGENFCYGPLENIYIDPNGAISVDIVYIHISENNATVPKLKLLGPSMYYFASWYKDRDSIGSLLVNVPSEYKKKDAKLFVDIWCDCHGFKVKVSLEGNRNGTSRYLYYRVGKWVNRQRLKPETKRLERKTKQNEDAENQCIGSAKREHQESDISLDQTSCYTDSYNERRDIHMATS